MLQIWKVLYCAIILAMRHNTKHATNLQLLVYCTNMFEMHINEVTALQLCE